MLSFHGTPGTGKNFIADQIVSSRYKLGKQSHYVHFYSGRAHFPLDSKAQEYSEMLFKTIVSAVRSCPHQTFIFDEVDKMPPGVFESLVAVLDHNTFLRDVDCGKAMFIFISNVGGTEISKYLSYLMRKKGLRREDTTIYHFERIIELAAYSNNGGFKKSRAIEKAVIDYFVPFMPLEKRHVELCLERFMADRSNIKQPKVLQSILNAIAYEEDMPMFAESGCKKLQARVDALIHTEL